MDPDYSFEGGSKRTLWLILGGSLLVIAAIVLLLIYFLHKQQTANNNTSGKGVAALTVGDYDYVYPCSVAAMSDYAAAFGLNDGGTIGYRYEKAALRGVSGDLTQLAAQADTNAGYTSSCALTMPKNPSAPSEVTATVTIKQFSGSKGADDSLNRDQLTAASLSNNPNVTPPTLPSFVTNSVLIAPVAPNNVLEASISHNNLYVTLDYALQDGDTMATATPKLDAFAKQIINKTDNKVIATKPTDLSGHGTFISTPFIDVCRAIDFPKLTALFTDVHFRPDNMTSDNQYGAPANLPEAGNGVFSSCGMTYNTAADRAGLRAFNTSPDAQGLSLEDEYPQGFHVAVNTYASTDAAKAALAAKKAAQTPKTPGLMPQDIKALGDAAYSYHGQNVYQKSATRRSAAGTQVNYTITEDDYVVLTGNRIVSISFQQNSESDPYITGPLTVNQTLAQQIFSLCKDMLSARNN